MFLCSLILSNTSSFLTWSVQLIFSILRKNHISKLSSKYTLYYNKTHIWFGPLKKSHSHPPSAETMELTS
jgi:hypothetical protein